MRVYVQLKSTTHTSKEGITLCNAGEKQVFEVDTDDLDLAWCMAYEGVPNVQRVLIGL